MPYKYFDGNWHVYLKYTITTIAQDRVANTSTVRVSLAVGNDSGGYRIEFDPTYGAYIGVQVAGQNKYLYFGDLFIAGSEKSLGSVEFTFTHDEDGRATRDISIWSGSTSGITYDGWYVGSLSLTTTETFERIPRMSTVKTVSDARELGKEITVTLDRKVDSFTHQAWYKVWGSDWIDLGKDIGTTFKFTPSTENAMKNINVASSTLDLCIRTFDGTKQIGRDEYSMGWAIGLPTGTQPKLQTLELTDKAKATKDIVDKNIFVQTFSEMICKFVGFEGTYGSTIKGYYAEVVGQKNAITKDGATFSYFKNYGDFQVQGYIVDSRGLKSNIVTIPIKVLEYFAPVLSFEVFRSGGDLQTLTVRRNLKIAPLIVNGVQKNTLTLKFQVKPANNGYFTDNAGAGINSKVVHTLTNSNADLSGKFSAASSWIVHGIISDAYTSFQFTSPPIGPESVVECLAPDGVGFGKIWERGTIDAKGDIYSHNELVQVGRLTQVNGKSLKMTGSANDLMKTGLFYSHGMSDLPPNLTGSQLYGYIQVNTHPNDNNYIMQTYTPYDANVIYMRRKTPGAGWQAWVRFTPSDIPQQKDEWHDAPLTNGWRHYGGNDTNVQYRRDAEGRIYLRGSCQGGTYINRGGTIFTLPKEYNPKKKFYLRAITGDYQDCYLILSPAGELYCAKDNQVKRDWLCLDGIII